MSFDEFIDEAKGMVDGAWESMIFGDTNMPDKAPRDPESNADKELREVIEKGRAEGWLE
jgi:hypothetical protein